MAVTASAMTHDRQQIMAAGFDAYQTKPISVKGFLEAVRECWTDGRAWRRAVSGPAKILVVDDTPHNLKLLGDLLGAKGYAVSPRPPGPRRWSWLTRSGPTWCCSTS